jgi:hypothetical protein
MFLFKTILIVAGTISLVLGILGIIIPGLPTTPFLLLTAALYLRSSERLYQKFTENRIFGRYIRKYRMYEGMTLKSKIKAILVMWLMIILSCIFVTGSLSVILIVLGAGLIGTLVLVFVVPAAKIVQNNPDEI